MRLYAGFAFSDFPYLFRVNVQPDFYSVMPRHRLIAFGNGDNGGFSTAGLTKALAYIHLDCQDVSLCCHFNVFRVLHLPAQFTMRARRDVLLWVAQTSMSEWLNF